MRLFLAYDGSVNGDWVARYAVRLASLAPERKLTLLYATDGKVGESRLNTGLAFIERIAAETGLTVETRRLSVRTDVVGALIDAIPPGPETLVVCGARAQGRQKGFLSGTVSKALLAHREFGVVAYRVVLPGLLGVARRILLPLSGSRHGVVPALPLMRLLARDIEEVRLLRVMTVPYFRLREFDGSRASRLRQEGYAALSELAEQLAMETGIGRNVIDREVRIASEWTRSVIVSAGQQRAELICLEAPRRSLQSRLVRGDPLERIMRDAPCDVAVFRGPLHGDR